MGAEIIINTKPKNPTDFKPGKQGFFDTEENLLVIIGENDTHVHTLLYRSGAYYSVFKDPENLKHLHVF
jgi:hypothetical protein